MKCRWLGVFGVKKLPILLIILVFAWAGGMAKAAVFEVNYVVESPHPYPDNYNYTWTIEQPNANAIRLHFVNYSTEPGFDFIYILDKDNNTIATYSGSGSDVWTPWVTGNVIKVRLVSDTAIHYYGFYIDKYQFEPSSVYINTLPYEITAPGYYILNVSVEDFDPTDYGVYYAIKINASNVVLDGNSHMLDSVDPDYGYGILVENANNVTIKNLILRDWEIGVESGTSTNVTFDNLTISSCVLTQAVLGYDSVLTNSIVANGRWGIATRSGSVVKNTYIVNMSEVGVSLCHSSTEVNCVAINNTIYNSRIGISISGGYGTVENNIIKNSNTAIHFFSIGAKGNVIKRNVIEALTAFEFAGGPGTNWIYDNIINASTYLVWSYGPQNPQILNTTKTSGTNIIGGPYIGGNAWFKPDGTGFSETCTDADGDGICDEPFVLNSLNIDYLPLALSGDRVPPQVKIVYPQNTTYSEAITSIKVNATDNSQISRVIAEVDGEYNVTLIFDGTYYVNTTINIGEGHHWIRIYAYDLAGNVNSTEIVYFTVEIPQRLREAQFLRLTYFYYLRYVRLLKMFNESYEQALQLGIDNETLSKVLTLKGLAEEEWKLAWQEGSPVITPNVRAFIHLRKAYLYLKEAETILEEFLTSMPS